jgi:hypothetical protein
MLNMEIDCKAATDREVKMQYWRTVGSWFTRPLFIYTTVICALLFFAISLNNFIITIVIIGIGFLVGTVLPLLLIFARRFKIGRIYGDPKESIRDSGFKWLIYGYFLVSWLILRPIFKFLNFLFMHTFHYSSTKTYGVSIIGHTMATISFMIVIIHFLTLVKLYRDEFKTQMVKA